MKVRADQLQRPVDPPRVVLRWREQNDPPRLSRLVEILKSIMDTAGTPGDGRRS